MEPPITPQLSREGVFPLREVLPGLHEREVFDEICGELPHERMLDEAHIVCFAGDGYPRVDDHTAHVLCPQDYLGEHDPLVIYLDIVHELVHVRQVLMGERVYHFPLRYVEWPTEEEAYRVGYHEALRLGLDDAWYWEYLEVPWATHEELADLAKRIGMTEIPPPPARPPSDDAGARR